MQTGARCQAVIEILTEVFKDEQPADKIIATYLRNKKYIGAKDRRFINDLTWKIIRNRLKLCFDSGSTSPRHLLLYTLRDKLNEIFDNSPYGLAPLTDDEEKRLTTENNAPYPDWVEAECPEWLFVRIKDMDLCKALNQEASTTIRAHNISNVDLQKKLAAEGIEATLGSYAPFCLKINQRLVLNNCIAWQDGLMDVQDEASQIASLMIDARPQHKIIDYCCGAGGKALALSQLLNNQGKILAYDIDAKRLDALKPRMTRLNVTNIELTDIIADSDKNFDRFILDAPCSGSGTWRRAPDAKFRLTPEHLKKLCATQANLLDIAATKTKQGGRIIYMTCSILTEENENQIITFLQKNPQFEPINLKILWEQKFSLPYPCPSNTYLRLSPLTTQTDGFFVCILERKS